MPSPWVTAKSYTNKKMLLAPACDMQGLFNLKVNYFILQCWPTQNRWQKSLVKKKKKKHYIDSLTHWTRCDTFHAPTRPICQRLPPLGDSSHRLEFYGNPCLLPTRCRITAKILYVNPLFNSSNADLTSLLPTFNIRGPLPSLRLQTTSKSLHKEKQ